MRDLNRKNRKKDVPPLPKGERATSRMPAGGAFVQHSKLATTKSVVSEVTKVAPWAGDWANYKIPMGIIPPRPEPPLKKKPRTMCETVGESAFYLSMGFEYLQDPRAVMALGFAVEEQEDTEGESVIDTPPWEGTDPPFYPGMVFYPSIDDEGKEMCQEELYAVTRVHHKKIMRQFNLLHVNK